MYALAFHSVYFFQSAGMSATGEVSTQVGSNDLAHQSLTYDPLAEAQHIGIVMFPGASGAERVMTHRSPDSWHFISDNGHANASTAD
jgi:hypothetical protein